MEWSILKYKIDGNRNLKPMLIIGKKEHPFGKPDDMHFLDLNAYIHAGYLSPKGYKFSQGIVNDLTIHFDNKEFSGWFHFGTKESRQLYEQMKKIFECDENGICKNQCSSLAITEKKREDKI